MAAYNPIAYTYNAAVHCPDCAAERFGRDERGEITGEDDEGNEVGAVWSWDDHDPAGEFCDDCGEEIVSPDPGPFLDAARKLGAEHGRNAGSWIFDGNSDTDAIVRVLRGLRDGDPAVYDVLPGSPLSGEWADGMTPGDLVSRVGAPDDLSDDLSDAYDEAWQDAMVAEVERSGYAMLGIEWVLSPSAEYGPGIAYWTLSDGSGAIRVEHVGTTHDGRPQHRYTLYGPDGFVVFHGDDHRGPVGADFDPPVAMLSVLTFLTLRPGDTDAEYFDGYTPDQIAWRDEFAEQLGAMVSIAGEVIR